MRSIKKYLFLHIKNFFHHNSSPFLMELSGIIILTNFDIFMVYKLFYITETCVCFFIIIFLVGKLKWTDFIGKYLLSWIVLLQIFFFFLLIRVSQYVFTLLSRGYFNFTLCFSFYFIFYIYSFFSVILYFYF